MLREPIFSPVGTAKAKQHNAFLQENPATLTTSSRTVERIKLYTRNATTNPNIETKEDIARWKSNNIMLFNLLSCRICKKEISKKLTQIREKTIITDKYYLTNKNSKTKY